jgi:Flp pilus assembly pilin Flp
MKVLNLIKRFAREERGMETVEWAVMAALIVGGLVLAVTTLGGDIKTQLTNLGTAISTNKAGG